VSAAITDTQGIIAIAAAAVGAVALLGCLLLAIGMRRMRRAQRLVLGEHGERDLVAHMAEVQVAFEALHDYVEDAARRLDARLEGVELTLRGRIAHRALVRYDAYNELSGHQSMSIALLDDESSGIVLSCIHHRDQARVYGKRVQGGRGELELSPEEAQAVRLAMAAPPVRVAGQPEPASAVSPTSSPGDERAG
jgi:hypothetical protein